MAVGSRRAFTVGRRRHTLATDPDLWHLAPSGMLESADGPGALAGAVHSELAEELGVFVKPAELRGRLTLLGIAHDLLRLRPDVCLRLDLSASELSSDGVTLSASEFAAHQLFELSRGGLKDFWSTRKPQELTPAAAGAIALIEG